MKTTNVPLSIDEYISSFPESIRERLEELRTAINKAAPDATEKISYQMPTFFLKGNLVHFAAHAKHIGFYPTPSAIEEFKKELEDYHYSKGAIQFPYDKPLDLNLISRMVKYRRKENLDKAGLKAKKPVTVRTSIEAPVEKVWEFWTDPGHITNWCFASDDWHAPYAENDLRVNGKFRTTMSAKDGSAGFDFSGIYTSIRKNDLIEYTIDDGRKVRIVFTHRAGLTEVTESFEPETTFPRKLQKAGWQSILDNFRKYAETN